MKIVRPYARMMAPVGVGLHNEQAFTKADGIDLLKRVEWCARISHRSEGLTGDVTWQRLLTEIVLKHGDWSVVEHCLVNVDALVDRGITHEIVRHRIASYTQESTRFVRYFKEKEGDVINPAQFIYPKPDVECTYCLSGQEVLEPHPENYHWRHGEDGLGYVECAYDTHWLRAIQIAEGNYKELLKKGWRPQEARSVFPNALASRIIITMNLRTWRHFFVMRTSQEAHPQMRQVMIPLLKEFQEKIPLLYDDIVPLGKQSEMMKLVR